MCNNRCLFCVSGQRTALGEALPLAVEPILARIREAHAAGHRKITLLGGEPTSVWLAEEGRRATGGYRLEAAEPTRAIVEGLRAVMYAVRP